MNKPISFIGGDYRNVKLAQMIKNDNFEIQTYGMENCEEISKYEKNNLQECVENSEVIVSSIPFSKNGQIVYMPLSNKTLEIKELFSIIKEKTLIAGSINKDIFKVVESDSFEKHIYDLMEDESLTISNAISTAEGAIQIAMQETKKTIHNSRILILGFGRIGKILAKDLQGLGAIVTCEARKKSDIAWIKVYGYNYLELDNLEKRIEDFEIIFNTIPHLILNKKLLKKVDRNCYIIDLASKPGGIDFKECDRLGIKYNWALALPGKVAPITSAEKMKECIYKIIKKE